MQAVKLEKASNAVWDSIANQCEYATYYQSREWAELWQVHTRGKVKPAARLLTLNDGTQVLLPLSVYKVSGGFIHQYISSPGWMYGGWLSAKPLSPLQSQTIWDFIREFNLIVRQNPFNPNFDLDHLSLAEIASTQVLGLKHGFDALHKYWTKNSGPFLRNVKQATKAGVTVEVATTLQDWQQYYQAYEDSIRRWGETFEGPKYSWD